MAYCSCSVYYICSGIAIMVRLLAGQSGINYSTDDRNKALAKEHCYLTIVYCGALQLACLSTCTMSVVL
jgi:hypothetical protein